MNLSLLDGLLLGDGSLWLPSPLGKRRTCNSYYRQSSVSLDWLLLLKQDALAAGLRATTRHDRIHVCKDGRMSDIWWLQIQAHPFFTEQASRWYPQRHKVCPTDVRLDRVSLTHWYLGDGTLKASNHTRRYSMLCTEGFAPDQVLTLVERLREMFGPCVNPQIRRKSFNIAFTYEGTDRFLDYLGPPPCPSLAYKWDTRLVRSEVSDV